MYAMDAGTCIVTATKAASAGYLAATSAPKTFTFTAAPVAKAQATLRVTNLSRMWKMDYTKGTVGTVGTEYMLRTSGGSGDGEIWFNYSGNQCFLDRDGDFFKKWIAGTCVITATKLASTGYLAATSAPKTFTFTAN